jgi:hypothetical protein
MEHGACHLANSPSYTHRLFLSKDVSSELPNHRLERQNADPNNAVRPCLLGFRPF